VQLDHRLHLRSERVGPADPVADYRAAGIQNGVVRNAAGGPAVAEVATAGQDREVVWELVPEIVQLVGRIVVGVDVGQGEIIVRVDIPEIALQMRKLLNAVASPGGAEIEQHHLGTLVVEIPGVAVGVFTSEVGRRFANTINGQRGGGGQGQQE